MGRILQKTLSLICQKREIGWLSKIAVNFACRLIVNNCTSSKFKLYNFDTLQVAVQFLGQGKVRIKLNIGISPFFYLLYFSNSTYRFTLVVWRRCVYKERAGRTLESNLQIAYRRTDLLQICFWSVFRLQLNFSADDHGTTSAQTENRRCRR